MLEGSAETGKRLNDEWFIYRLIVDDRIYFVLRVGALLCVGWLRLDGMQFGGNPKVWERWVSPMCSAYLVTIHERLH